MARGLHKERHEWRGRVRPMFRPNRHKSRQHDHKVCDAASISSARVPIAGSESQRGDTTVKESLWVPRDAYLREGGLEGRGL